MAKQRNRNNDTDGGGRNPKPARPLKVAFSEFRFVRLEFTESEKSEFRAMLAGGEFDEIPVSDLLRDGYKLAASYDATHDTLVVSLTAQYRDMDNSGLVLTGRGKDYSTALAAVYYKHVYLAPDGLWAAAEITRGGSYSDIG